MAHATEPSVPSSVDDGVGEDRLLTLPNIITVIRLACLPVFLWVLFEKEDEVLAACILGALGATDWVDGYIARHWNQVSSVGKVLDPVADRLLFFVGGGAILVVGAVPTWLAVAILGREVLISLLTVGLALLGGRRVDVTWWGKAGTFCLMFALPLFLASEGDLAISGLIRLAAWGFAIPGLVLAYVAFFLYVPIGLAALREGRAGREAGAG